MEFFCQRMVIHGLGRIVQGDGEKVKLSRQLPALAESYSFPPCQHVANAKKEEARSTYPHAGLVIPLEVIKKV